MSDVLPPALLARLRSDALSFSESAASSSLSDATSSGRGYASRKLLSLTPKALSTVDRVMSSQNDKDALAAASLVLSKSPATRDESTLLGDSALSSSLVAALSSSLQSFASAFAALAPSSPPHPVDVDASAVYVRPLEPASAGSVEVDMESSKERLSPESGFTLDTEGDPVNTEPLPLASLPPASGKNQLTSAGLVPLNLPPAESISAKDPPVKAKKTTKVAVKKADKSAADDAPVMPPMPMKGKPKAPKGKKC